MNKLRRLDLDKAIALLEEAKELIEAAASEERDYFDNMPESLQSGDRGQKAEAAAGGLDEAVESLADAIDEIIAASE